MCSNDYSSGNNDALYAAGPDQRVTNKLKFVDHTLAPPGPNSWIRHWLVEILIETVDSCLFVSLGWCIDVVDVRTRFVPICNRKDNSFVCANWRFIYVLI